jgi:hypothetical protein
MAAPPLCHSNLKRSNSKSNWCIEYLVHKDRHIEEDLKDQWDHLAKEQAEREWRLITGANANYYQSLRWHTSC